MSDFRDTLKQADRHPSQRYFILKSIVLNNLYGVDIMEEAVEICKLRLFLKLVAQLESYDQIEPLPDIDFNIKAGNTLVGFTSLEAVRRAMTITPDGQLRALDAEQQKTLERIEADAGAASEIYDHFRRYQITPDSELDSILKQQIKEGLGSLRTRLDGYQATQYGIDQDDGAAYANWVKSHQPFHWFVEFYGIMNKGGFDVVIGNPPYVEYSKVKSPYTVKSYKTEPCGNLYAFVVERNRGLCSSNGRTSMIVPHSAICTDRMAEVQTVLFDDCLTWSSTYDIRPSKLFEGVDQRLCIYISRKANGGASSFTSRYHRWHEGKRSTLFHDLEYVDSTRFTFTNSVPKMDSLLDSRVLAKLKRLTPLGSSLSGRRVHTIYYHNAPRYWVRATDFAPYFWNERNGEQISTQVKRLTLATDVDADAVVAALNSSLFYWWFILLSDSRHLNLREIESFPLALDRMKQTAKKQLAQLTDELMENFKHHSQRKETRYQTTGKVIYDEFDQKPSKPIVDKIDRVLAKHYGFTEEELDFIINYDIKYRMGREG